MNARLPLAILVVLALVVPLDAQVNEEAADADRLQYLDVFELEVAADPRISPDGSRIVYVRRGFDIMTDGRRTALWMIGSAGTDHRALTDATSTVGSPRWSPDGSRLLYVSSEDGSSQVFVRWMEEVIFHAQSSFPSCVINWFFYVDDAARCSARSLG